MAMTTAEAPVITSDPGAFAKFDDGRLVSAVHDGYDEAFEVFYTRHHPGVLSFCRHMLGSREDAEDAAQQTFLATYRQIHGSSPPSHPRAWLYTVARNRCLSTLRARRETSSDALEPTTEGLAEEVERRQELRELIGDLGRLPEEQRVALLLFELGALDQAEIAETIGCKPKKVKALVYQARTTLAHRADARNARCAEVRQQLATLRGGTLNNRALKHHLEVCDGCATYRQEVRRQRARFGLILPVIPLAGSHGAAFAALGLGSASHAAYAGTAHTVVTGTSYVVPRRLARAAAYLARPRIAAIGALTAGAVAGVAVLIPGGHERQHTTAPVAPPAASVRAHAKPAHKSVALAAHHVAKKLHPHAVTARAVAVQSGRTNGPAAVTQPPHTRNPSAGKPPPPPKPQAPKQPVHQAPPKNSHPAPQPTKPAPTTPTGSTPAPATPPPASSCAPNGQGGGNAWGRCKGPDGLPAPAEQHRNGNGAPGGPHGPKG